MNYFIFISALITVVALVGQLTMGRKEYLIPVLNSDIELVPKKMMQSLFYSMSALLALSLIVLLAGSHQSCPMYDYVHNMVRFVGMAFGLFALTQFILVVTSGMSGGVFKLFQWVFWALISLFAILGTI